jgi:hypothetical protein
MSVNCLAQFHNEKFLRSGLTLYYENQPQRNFTATDSTFQFTKYAMSFKQPVLNRVSRGADQGSFKLTGLLFNLKASRNDLVMDFLHENRKLQHVSSGLYFSLVEKFFTWPVLMPAFRRIITSVVFLPSGIRVLLC